MEGEKHQSSREEEAAAIDELICQLLRKKTALRKDQGESSSEAPVGKMKEELGKEELGKGSTVYGGINSASSNDKVSYVSVVGASQEKMVDKATNLGAQTSSRDRMGTVQSKSTTTNQRGNEMVKTTGGTSYYKAGNFKNINKGGDMRGNKSYGWHQPGSQRSNEYSATAQKRNYEKEEGEIIRNKNDSLRGGEKRKESQGEWTVVKRKKSPPKVHQQHGPEMNDIQCFNCAEIGHTRFACRNPPKCFKCQKSGHTAPFCHLHDRESDRGEGNLTEKRESLKRCSVRFQRSMEQEEQRLMKMALVATVTKGRPSERDLVEEFKKRWPSLQGWIWSIRRLSPSSFLIPFPHEWKIQEVISKGELEFDGFVLHFRRWSLQIGAWRRNLIHKWVVISHYQYAAGNGLDLRMWLTTSGG